MTDVPLPTASNPFVGPRSFDRGEVLFGRDREIQEIRDVVIAERTILLHSPSGAGKTSLLEASLRPELMAQGFDIRPTIRVGYEVPESPGMTFNRYVLSAIMSLEAQDAEGVDSTLSSLARLSLPSYVASVKSQLSDDVDLCLFFDQFEEIFTLDPVDQDEKMEFFSQLGTVLRDPGVWALIAMREDYIAELEPYVRFLPRRLSTRYRLDFLDRSAAAAAIIGPSTGAGREFSRSAIDHLVEDLSRVRIIRNGEDRLEPGPSVEPVQLQVVCRQLWQKLQKHQGIVEREDIDGLVNTDGALAEFYALQMESVARQCGVSERRIRQWIGSSLITPQGFRAQAFEFPDENGGAVLHALEDAYVIRSDRRRGVTWYELTHDRLVSPINADNAEWERSHLSPVQQRALDWDKQSRSSGLLISGEVLTQAERWVNQDGTDVSDLERDFIASSRHEEDQAILEARQSRRRATVYLVLAVLAVVGMIASVLFFISARRSLDDSQIARAEAEARELVSRALAADDPYNAVLLALEAEFRTDEPLPFARKAWLEASRKLATSPVRLASPVLDLADSRPVASAWSPDGELFALRDDAGTVTVVDQMGRLISRITLDNESIDLHWNFDGSLLLANSRQGVHLIDPRNSDEQVRLLPGTQTSSLWDGGWSPTTNKVLLRVDEVGLSIFDIDSGETVPLLDDFCDRAEWNATGEIVAAICPPNTSPTDDTASFSLEGQVIVFESTGEVAWKSRIASGAMHFDWNRDGSELAILDADFMLHILDRGGNEIREALGPFMTPDASSYTYGVDWSSPGSQLSVETSSLWLVDTESGVAVEPLGASYPSGGYFAGVSWNPIEKLFAAHVGQGRVALFDSSGVRISEDVISGVSDVALMRWNADGSRLAVLNLDGSINLMDISGAAVGRSFSAGPDPVSIEWHPDGKRLTVVDADGSMRLIEEFRNSSSIRVIPEVKSGSGGVAWRPNDSGFAADTPGSGLLIVDGEGVVQHQFWNDPGIPRNSCLVEIDFNCDWTFDVENLQWSSDGTHLLVRLLNSRDFVLDQGGRFKFSIEVPGEPPDISGPITSSWSPQGNEVLATFQDGSVLIFDVDGNSRRINVPEELSSTGGWPVASWSPSGSWIALIVDDVLIAVDHLTGATKVLGDLWPSVSEEETSGYAIDWVGSSDVLAIRASHYPNDSSASAQSEIVIVERSGKVAARFNDVSEYPVPTWSRNGALLMTDTEGRLRLMGADGQSIGDSSDLMKCEDGTIWQLSWSPNGEYFATTCEATINIHHFNGAVRSSFVGQTENIMGMEWSKNGQFLVFEGDDGLIRFIDLDGNEVANPIRGGNGFYSAIVSWGSLGNKLAIGAGRLEILYGWSERNACDLLRTVMTSEHMDDVLDLDGYTSRCGSEDGVEELPIIPISSQPFDFF